MNKKRYWAFVLYPESAPLNWKEQLQQTGLSIAISPLHNKDIDPTGQPKKEHYHIILCYDGPTTFNNVKKITESLNQPIPIPLEQVKGYFRYLTHKDNPDKFQYNEDDIQVLNGFDTNDYNSLTYSQVKSIIIELCSLIRNNDIFEYSDLINLLLDNDMLDALDVASNHTIFFNSYITSIRHKFKDYNIK